MRLRLETHKLVIQEVKEYRKFIYAIKSSLDMMKIAYDMKDFEEFEMIYKDIQSSILDVLDKKRDLKKDAGFTKLSKL